ncbi:MAG TPA: aldo/keto reductase [Bacteroidales bacterium]|nr:aldo/keto reductase [Bacteroidales bacterium]
MNDFNKLILGTVQFGLDYGINNHSGKPSEEQTFNILDEARRLGIKRLDTADAYGKAINIIGRYHSKHHVFKILNKFTFSDQSCDIAGKVNKSLKTLNIDSFDVYSYHSFFDFESNHESQKILQGLKNEKLIKNIGISVYTNQEFEKAINSEVIDVIQLPFNILDNHVKRGLLLEKAKKNSKEIHVRSVFLQGLIFMNEVQIPEKLKPLSPYLMNIVSFCRNQHLSLAEIAMTYAFTYPYIDGVLIGVDNIDQLKTNISCIRSEYADTITDFIETINVTEAELLNPSFWK